MLDKDSLSLLVNQGFSQHKIAKLLNCSQSTTRRYLLKFDLKTVQTGRSSTKICISCSQSFKGKRGHQKFCSSKCQKKLARKVFIDSWLLGTTNGNTKKNNTMSCYIRRWLFEQRGEQCWQCGWNQKHPNSGKCPLEVDHIDGHYTNNRPENLRLLCPNCHSLTPTYRGYNKGNGRHYRRERYANGQSF